MNYELRFLITNYAFKLRITNYVFFIMNYEL